MPTIRTSFAVYFRKTLKSHQQEKNYKKQRLCKDSNRQTDKIIQAISLSFLMLSHIGVSRPIIRYCMFILVFFTYPTNDFEYWLISDRWKAVLLKSVRKSME